jgi:hypothetical protein
MKDDQYKAMLTKSMVGKRMILHMYNEQNRPSIFRRVVNKIKLWLNI